MTPPRPTLRLLLGVVLAAVAPSVSLAQTTVNPQALDQLAPAGPSSAAGTGTPSTNSGETTRHRRTHTRTTHAPRGGTTHGTSSSAPHSGSKPAAKPPAKPKMPVVPTMAPPAPVLPPPIAVPSRPAPPAEPVAVVPDAPGAALARKDGLQVTFGVGRAELNPATVAAVRALAHAAPAGARNTYAVSAYAGGNADDPSTPRRLSLDRALAIRTLLMTEGIPSERIYVKAMGPPPAGGDAAADRVDIAVTIPPPPAPAASPAPAPPTGGPAPATAHPAAPSSPRP